MGRNSIFPDEQMPDLPDKNASEEEKTRIYNRRYYLRHKAYVKFLNRLRYRCFYEKKRGQHFKQRWEDGKKMLPRRKTLLEQGDPDAIEATKRGKKLYKRLLKRYWEKKRD